jgi:hypothetical protein
MTPSAKDEARKMKTNRTLLLVVLLGVLFAREFQSHNGCTSL